MADLPPLPPPPPANDEPVTLPPPPPAKVDDPGLSERAKKESVDELLQKKPRKNLAKKVRIGNKPGAVLTKAKLSKSLGVHTGTIDHWLKLGMPFIQNEIGTKEYELGKVVEWRVQYEADAVRETFSEIQPIIEDKMTALEAERREKAAKAQLAELKLAKERGLVANIDDIMENVASALGEVRAALMSFKSSLPGRLAHKDERFIEKALAKETQNLLEKLSGYNHDYQETEK